MQGETVWSGEDEAGNEASLRWTWLDLLEFLGRNWPWLVLEESYPIPVTPLLAGSDPADHYWELDPERLEADTEILAAARMSAGVVGIDIQRAILQRLRRVKRFSTPEIEIGSPEVSGMMGPHKE